LDARGNSISVMEDCARGHEDLGACFQGEQQSFRVHAAIQPEASHRMPIELAAAAIFAGALSVLLGRDRRRQPVTALSSRAAPRAAR